MKSSNRRLSESLSMSDRKPDDLKLFLRALSRWDNEGGAIPHDPQEGLRSNDMQSEIPQLTNAELVQLRIRVIALENLVIALLAGVSDQQIDLAREMATYISPRPGFTHHPLTIHAATQMNDLVDRAGHFRDAGPSSSPSVSSPGAVPDKPNS